jgi:hypothetical protein
MTESELRDELAKINRLFTRRVDDPDTSFVVPDFPALIARRKVIKSELNRLVDEQSYRDLAASGGLVDAP